jgi:Trp repressor protein.
MIMSENVRSKGLRKPLRLKIIKEQLPYGKTQKEIAEKCGVSLKTIERDVSEWKTSGEFDKWLDLEWFREYQHQTHQERFRALTRLKEKRMTQRTEYEYTNKNIQHIKLTWIE